MRLRRVVFGTVGLLATVVATLLAVAPDAVGSLVAVFETLDPTGILLASSVVVGGCGLLAAWAAGRRTRPATSFDAAVELSPESVTGDDSRLVGSAVDEAVDEAIAGDPASFETVVARLQTAAATAHATATDVPRSAAEQAVRAGTWTDDAVAAALLAPEEPQPVLARLRLWLDPEAERERRISRTVSEIEQTAGGAS